MRVESSLDRIRKIVEDKAETVEFPGAFWFLMNNHKAAIRRVGWSDRQIRVKMIPTVVDVVDGVELPIDLESDDLMASDWQILEPSTETAPPSREINYRPLAGDTQR